MEGGGEKREGEMDGRDGGMRVWRGEEWKDGWARFPRDGEIHRWKEQ